MHGMTTILEFPPLSTYKYVMRARERHSFKFVLIASPRAGCLSLDIRDASRPDTSAFSHGVSGGPRAARELVLRRRKVLTTAHGAKTRLKALLDGACASSSLSWLFELQRADLTSTHSCRHAGRPHVIGVHTRERSVDSRRSAYAIDERAGA
jgi:hypothetical protein